MTAKTRNCKHDWKQRTNSFVEVCTNCGAQLIPYQSDSAFGEWAMINTKCWGPLPMEPGRLYVLQNDAIHSPCSQEQLQSWWKYIEELQEKVEKLEQQLREVGT